MLSPGRGAALLALACAAPRAWADGVQVRLTELTRKTYSIEGVFQVKASSTAVWDVLTDYDRIGRFVSSMRHSRVVETRPDGTLIMEQEAVGRVLFFSRTVRLRLEVRRDAEGLRFEDLDHKDFRRYAGSWTTRAAAGGTEVTYRLEAEPDFMAPSLLKRRGLRRGAKDLLEQVRAEILRREARETTTRAP